MTWECPYCHHQQIASTENTHSVSTRIYDKASAGDEIFFKFDDRICLNRSCQKRALTCSTWDVREGRSNDYPGTMLRQWKLLPSSVAKIIPDYVPRSIAEDYSEACEIVELSPKASATLSRRCLQGMIRDFCQIDNHKLANAIRALRTMADENRLPRGVDAETLDAIDVVREVGNIGAHMEQDINIIVDVDPSEAQKLIDLIELLIDDWYVARHNRQERIRGIQKIAEEKREERQSLMQAAQTAAAQSDGA